MVFQERTYSVLLVSASEKFNTGIQPLLPAGEYWPVRIVKSVAEAQRALTELSYDLVIINSPLPDDYGIRLAVSICGDSPAGVLLLVRSEQYDDIYAKVVGEGVLTMSKPTTLQMLSQNLRVLCATRERLRKLEKKQVSVESRIEEIRLINRAKWLLIQNLNMTEDSAHRYIEKHAMDLRCSKREVAENIIKTYQGA